MKQRSASRFQKKPRSRYAFAAFCFFSLLAVFTTLRAVLFFRFETAHVAPWNILLAFAAGFYRDTIAALFLVLPSLFWCFIIGNRLFASARASPLVPVFHDPVLGGADFFARGGIFFLRRIQKSFASIPSPWIT